MAPQKVSKCGAPATRGPEPVVTTVSFLTCGFIPSASEGSEKEV